MRPVAISGAQVVLGRPATWDEEKDGHCGGLPVRREVGEGGHLWMASAWEPTPEELQQLLEGGHVILRVSCPQHPVTSLSVSPAAPVDDLVEGLTPPP